MLIPANLRLVAAGLLVSAAFSAGWYVNGLRWESRTNDLLKEQAAVLVGQCKDNIKITEKASDDYLRG